MKRDLVRLRRLIEECPALRSDEKALLVAIDVEGKSVTEVAKNMNRAKSTVSEKRSKARQKFDEYTKKSTDQDFAKLVFSELNSGVPPNQIVAKYGRPEEVKKLSEMWKGFERDDLWKAIKVLEDYGVINGPSTDTEGLLLSGVKALTAILDQAEGKIADAEEKLRLYEKKYGTLEELAVRIAVLEDDYRKLPSPVVQAISHMDIQKVAEKYSEKWRKEAVKNMVTCDISRLQHEELRRNLEFYRKRHGSNIKIGDIITNNVDFPGVLYLVVGESEDKQSWLIRSFARPELEEFLKTYKHAVYVGRDFLERKLSKALAIEKYGIVDIG